MEVSMKIFSDISIITEFVLNPIVKLLSLYVMILAIRSLKKYLSQ